MTTTAADCACSPHATAGHCRLPVPTGLPIPPSRCWTLHSPPRPAPEPCLHHRVGSRRPPISRSAPWPPPENSMTAGAAPAPPPPAFSPTRFVRRLRATQTCSSLSDKERKKINLSRFYSIAQIEYCRNFIFKRNFPIHKLFERSCELGLWRLTAHKISEIFGQRLPKRMSGKLARVIDQIEHGHHVYRAYFKHAFLKQYEKFLTFLRNELCSNNLKDFGLKKSLDNLEAVREKFQAITSRFASYQAQWLNDYPC